MPVSTLDNKSSNKKEVSKTEQNSSQIPILSASEVATRNTISKSTKSIEKTNKLPSSSPADLINKKVAGDTTLLSESQQEIALRMSRSEKTNKELKENDAEKSLFTVEQVDDPIKARILQQLEIRRMQQENNLENEELIDDENNQNFQEQELNQAKNLTRASIVSTTSQTAEKIIKQEIKRKIVIIIISIMGSIMSIILTILLPILIIIFCIVLVYNYISEHKISSSYYIMTNQFEKILNNAINNIPPDSAAATSNQNSD